MNNKQQTKASPVEIWNYFAVIAPVLIYLLVRFCSTAVIEYVALHGPGNVEFLGNDGAEQMSTCLMAVGLLVFQRKRLDHPDCRKGFRKRWLTLTVLALSLSIVTGRLAISLAIEQTAAQITPLMLFSHGVAGPFLEEIVYRKLVLNRGIALLGCTGSVVLSSLLFGASHQGIPYAMLAAAVGAVLAMVVLRDQSCIGAILVHIMMNLFSMIGLEYSPPNYITLGGILFIGIFIASSICQMRSGQIEGT